MCDTSWLPGLVCLEDYGGNWPAYEDAIYHIFCQDFIESQSWLLDRHVRINKTPTHNGRAYTFWHIISDGPVEADRLPNLRRCERIRWPRAIIDAYATDGRILYWRIYQKGEWKLKLALPDLSYVMVFSDRSGYVFLKTAFHVDRRHTYENLQKEYEENKRTDGAR